MACNLNRKEGELSLPCMETIGLEGGDIHIGGISPPFRDHCDVVDIFELSTCPLVTISRLIIELQYRSVHGKRVTYLERKIIFVVFGGDKVTRLCCV